MTGWRIWTVEDGQLVSPFARLPMPSNGVITNVCPDFIPYMCDEHGVSYFATAADALQAVKTLDDDMAVTTGEIIGKSWPDPRQPLYRISGFAFSRHVTLPAGRRCDEYRVSEIYTDSTLFTYNNIQTQKLSHLST
ncbi:hypothetical protein [Mycolicibacterium sp. CR10]|uniref:hypothetical protein n=1 Tax=Mycolicibacterium sp. CR10 TaxID=2562314 RepID=UPI0010C0F456|nr:hypothetical protein [Mycolicibacterium sp. CR10]